MIQIEDVSVSFDGKQILNHVSLVIKPQSTICIMGDSGAGKSTLLKLLMGLIKPDSGRVLGVAHRKISVVFQEDRLCEQLSAIKNVMMVLEGKQKREIAREHLLELIEPEVIEQPVIQFSGGMKRRVSIARAFAYPSDIILMDEPFTGLDADTKKKVIQYMIKHKRQRTVIFVTHDCSDASALMTDEVVHISYSNVVKQM